MDKIKIASKLVSIAKALVAKEVKAADVKEVKAEDKTAMSMLVIPTRKYQLKPILNALRSALGVERGEEADFVQYLTNMNGTSNKFHYFAIFETDDGDYVGGNAYGRIGYNPKAIEIARGNLSHVKSAVERKVSQKLRKGYDFDTI